MTGRDGNACEHDTEPGWLRLTQSERVFLLEAIDTQMGDYDLGEEPLVLAMTVATKVRAAGPV